MSNPYQSPHSWQYRGPDQPSDHQATAAGYGPQYYGQPGVGNSYPTKGPEGSGKVNVSEAFSQLGGVFGRFSLWVLLQGFLIIAIITLPLVGGFLALMAIDPAGDTASESETLTTAHFFIIGGSVLGAVFVALLLLSLHWTISYNLAKAVADSLEVSFADCFRFRRAGALFAVVLLGTVLVILTAITLIGPLIVLYVMSFSFAALIDDESCGVFESLSRSWQMIKNDFGGTLLLNLASGALGYVAGSVGLGAFSLPYAAMLHLIGYRQYHGIASPALMHARTTI